MTSHNRNTKRQPGWNKTEPKVIKDLGYTKRVGFRPEEFDRLIDQHGVKVRVYVSTYCPRVKSIDGAEHEIDCPLCGGTGFIDVKPICTRALLQNQTLEKLGNVEGFVDGNTTMATFPIGIELQYFTLIELVDHTEIFFQRVVRSDTDIDKLKYHAKRVNAIIDYVGNSYEEGSNFKIDPSGHILWIGSNRPAENTIYSIHYEAAVQFRTTRAIHTNRFSQVKDEKGNYTQVRFQEEWVLTKEFLVRRMDVNGQEILQNNIPTYSDELPEE